MVATPPKPSRTPAIFRAVIRSSLVSTWATTTPQIGVVALRIEARPLAIWVWLHPNSVNGSALLRTASRRIDPHTRAGARCCRRAPSRKSTGRSRRSLLEARRM